MSFELPSEPLRKCNPSLFGRPEDMEDRDPVSSESSGATER